MKRNHSILRSFWFGPGKILSLIGKMLLKINIFSETHASDINVITYTLTYTYNVLGHEISILLTTELVKCASFNNGVKWFFISVPTRRVAKIVWGSKIPNMSLLLKNYIVFRKWFLKSECWNLWLKIFFANYVLCVFNFCFISHWRYLVCVSASTNAYSFFSAFRQSQQKYLKSAY